MCSKCFKDLAGKTVSEAPAAAAAEPAPATTPTPVRAHTHATHCARLLSSSGLRL